MVLSLAYMSLVKSCAIARTFPSAPLGIRLWNSLCVTTVKWGEQTILRSDSLTGIGFHFVGGMYNAVIACC